MSCLYFFVSLLLDFFIFIFIFTNFSDIFTISNQPSASHTGPFLLYACRTTFSCPSTSATRRGRWDRCAHSCRPVSGLCPNSEPPITKGWLCNFYPFCSYFIVLFFIWCNIFTVNEMIIMTKKKMIVASILLTFIHLTQFPDMNSFLKWIRNQLLVRRKK